MNFFFFVSCLADGVFSPRMALEVPPCFFHGCQNVFSIRRGGGFLARKLRDPAACRLVLIAGKSHPKTGAVVSTIWALGWARIFCHIFANPCFLVLDWYYTLASHSYAYFFELLFLDFESRPLLQTPVQTPKTASITGLFYPTKVN